MIVKTSNPMFPVPIGLLPKMAIEVGSAYSSLDAADPFVLSIMVGCFYNPRFVKLFKERWCSA